MPIDPNIYGSIRPAAAVDPMQTLAQVSVMRNQQLQRQEAQQRIAINQAAEERLNQSAALGDQKRQEELAKAERKRQVDSDLTAYLSSGQHIEPDKVYEITRDDPERGTAVLHGLEALTQLHNKTVQDVRQNALQLMGGVQALGPDARVAIWPQLRQEAIEFGYPAERIPEQYDEAFVQASLRSLQTPQQQADADKPKVVGTHVLTPDYKTEIANYPAEQKPSDFESYLIGPYARSVGKDFKTLADAYGPNGLNRQQVEQAREAYRLDQQTPVSVQITQGETEKFSKLPTDMQTVFGLAASRLDDKERRAAMNDVVREMENGRMPQAKLRIRRAAVDSESVADRQVINARADIKASMVSIAAALKEIPQGLMGATIEDTMRKLGSSTDPKMARVRGQIESSLAQYRHGMTGAAFGEAEAARYEKQFPNYRNQPVVNIALMQGFLDDVNVRDRSYWEGKLGTDGAAFVGALDPVDITKPSKSSAAPGPAAARPNPF